MSAAVPPARPEVLGPLLPAAALAKRALLLPRSWRLQSALLGPPGAPEARYVGDGESLPFLARLHGGAAPAGTVPLPRLRAELARTAGVPLRYAEVDRLLAGVLPRDGLRSAAWVRQVVVIGSPEELRHRGARRATIGRRTRRAGFGWRRTSEPAALDRFVRGLYLPYVHARFAGDAAPRGPAELAAAVRRGFLAEVVAGEEVVAAAVCRRTRGGLAVLAYGVAPPHERWLAAGALGAVNHFLLEWALAEGLARVDLLRARPHRDDGVYEHKRRLGATAALDPWPHAALWVRVEGDVPPGARGLLVRRGGRLMALDEALAVGGA